MPSRARQLCRGFRHTDEKNEDGNLPNGGDKPAENNPAETIPPPRKPPPSRSSWVR